MLPKTTSGIPVWGAEGTNGKKGRRQLGNEYLQYSELIQGLQNCWPMPRSVGCSLYIFSGGGGGVQAMISCRSSLTRRHSRNLSESRIRAAQCYGYAIRRCGSGHNTCADKLNLISGNAAGTSASQCATGAHVGCLLQTDGGIVPCRMQLWGEAPFPPPHFPLPTTPPPPLCNSYAKVPNPYGPYAYCSLDKGVASVQHIQLLTHT